MTDTTPTDEGMWAKVLGFFVANKLVVWILAGLMLFAGLAVTPFAWEALDELPRERVPVDAIPDIGENQQIVFTRWEGRSPKDIEDQISYPLTTALLGIPGVKSVRSYSMFGFSSIYVIFEEGVEFYWSRSRILEKLNSLPAGTVPEGVTPSLGPDATALGQVFWYTLEGRTPEGEPAPGWDLHELRSIQDFTVKYALQAVPGVSEVASVGGYVKEYQVDVDPEALRAHGVTIGQVADAVRQSNLDVGARTLEINNVEYVIRGLGFIEDVEDIEQTVVVARDSTPIRIRDVANVHLGPANRRGALDIGGAEAVGGVVVARYGENPMAVIERIKEKIAEIEPGLPTRTLEDGTVSTVEIVPFYDRSELIAETLGTLSTALIQQILITIIVVLVLLRHLRSSLLISLMLPLSVLASFLLMKGFGVDANVMSLAGIAIAIGTMVDMGIVLVENIVEHLEAADPAEDRRAVVRRAAAEVAPAVATSVLTTVVSFLPVFALTAAEGKLFRPLAYTKTFALITALGLSLLVLPAFAHLLMWREAERYRDADGQPLPWWRALARSAVRPDHVRDWILVALGVAMAVLVHLWAGLFIVLVGLFALAKPVLPGRWQRVPGWAESAIAVVAMVLLLTDDWMPLGFGHDFGPNLVFVVGIIGVLMALFLVFLKFYDRILAWTLDHKVVFLLAPALLMTLGFTMWRGFEATYAWLPESLRTSPLVVRVAHALPGFGREFMPAFDEGSYLVMPTTMPHVSFGKAQEMLEEMDARIQAVPEVELAVGKLGRVESSLDPAPISMFETVVNYKPEWRIDENGERVRQWRDHIQTTDDIWQEIVEAAQLPGLTSAPKLMPINTRIIMLQTGMRAPMGIKVRGPDLETIEAFGLRLEELLQEVPAIRPETVFAERIVGKPYLEIAIDREALGRHGLQIEDVQDVIQVGIGGIPLTRTIEGRERYVVRARFAREERDSIDALRRIPVATPAGAQIPLEQVADVRYVKGPQVIKAENTFLVGYVIFDRQPEIAETDAVEQAQAYLAEKIDSGELVVPEGVSYTFTGSYENQLRSEKRLTVLIPLALALIFLILYMQFRNTLTTFIIYTGVAVAVSGGFILIWLYGQPWFLDFDVFGVSMRELFQVGPVNMSVAVWVGFIALVGIATDDGVVMATYLKQQFDASTPETVAGVRRRVLEAGMRRVRPCLMTTATTMLALLPVLTSRGRGSDVMVPMALPSVGGMAIELVTLFVVPVLYCAVEEFKLRRRQAREVPEVALPAE